MKSISIIIPDKFKYMVIQPWGGIEFHVEKPTIHDGGPGDQYWEGANGWRVADVVAEELERLSPPCPEWQESLVEI